MAEQRVYPPSELVVHPVLVRGRERVLIRRGNRTLRIELEKARWLADQLHDISDLQEENGRLRTFPQNFPGGNFRHNNPRKTLMGHAIELAKQQQIRLHNHLSESTEHTEENFYTIPEEVEVTKKIHGILLANHPSFTG